MDLHAGINFTCVHVYAHMLTLNLLLWLSYRVSNRVSGQILFFLRSIESFGGGLAGRSARRSVRHSAGRSAGHPAGRTSSRTVVGGARVVSGAEKQII